MAAKKKTRRSRSLRGTPSEHLEHATYRLRSVTSARIDRMTCGEIGKALFTVGTIMAHASEADRGSATGRKLYAMASARRDQVFARAKSCGIFQR